MLHVICSFRRRMSNALRALPLAGDSLVKCKMKKLVKMSGGGEGARGRWCLDASKRVAVQQNVAPLSSLRRACSRRRNCSGANEYIRAGQACMHHVHGRGWNEPQGASNSIEKNCCITVASWLRSKPRVAVCPRIRLDAPLYAKYSHSQQGHHIFQGTGTCRPNITCYTTEMPSRSAPDPQTCSS
jgi:hypothetical protein